VAGVRTGKHIPFNPAASNIIKNGHHSDEEITYLHLLLQQKEKQTCLPPRNVTESDHLFTANHLKYWHALTNHRQGHAM